jgi:hypothetical protein
MHRTKDQAVKRGIASNPNTPHDILTLYFRMECEDIRYMVAKNEAFRITDIHQALKDPSPYVRAGIAQNMNLEQEWLRELVCDVDYWVRLEASKSLSVLTAQADS